MSIDKKSAETPIYELLTLTTVNGQQIDVLTQMLNMEIYEDIFSPVITGSITLLDNINLFYKLPICGEEKLTVKFRSWNYDPSGNQKVNYFHRTFDIIKITNVNQLTDYSMQYTLQFASPELKKNETTHISKAFKSQTISKIVSNIMTNDYDVEEPTGLGFPTEVLNEPWVRSPFVTDNDIEVQYQKIDEDDSIELFVEKTKYEEPCITIPYMKPFDIINWLSQRAMRNSAGRAKQSASQDSANFLFFENKRGFNFVSIDTLLENKENVNTEFSFGNGVQNKSTGSGMSVVSDTIDTLDIQDCYDVLTNIRNGMYASKLYSYDLYTGETYEKDYDYLKTFPNTESTDRGLKNSPLVQFWGENIGDFPLMKLDNKGENPLTQKPLSKRMFNVFNPSGGVDVVTSDQTERNCIIREELGAQAYVQKRLSQLARWAIFRIIMTVAGNSVHTVGNVVKLDLKDFAFKGNYTDFTEKDSNFYNGYYLITSLRHSLTKDKYQMTMEVARDSSTSIITNPKELSNDVT